MLTGSGRWDRLYDYPEPKLHTVTITAPSEAVIRIGGLRVTDVFLKETGSTLPDLLGNTISLCTYAVNTVYGEAEVTAHLDETPLLARQEADDYRFDAPAASYTLLAPANAKVFANGKALSDDQITAVDALWKSEFSGLSAAPSATEYTLSNLYAPRIYGGRVIFT